MQQLEKVSLSPGCGKEAIQKSVATENIGSDRGLQWTGHKYILKKEGSNWLYQSVSFEGVQHFTVHIYD